MTDLTTPAIAGIWDFGILGFWLGNASHSHSHSHNAADPGNFMRSLCRAIWKQIMVGKSLVEFTERSPTSPATTCNQMQPITDLFRILCVPYCWFLVILMLCWKCWKWIGRCKALQLNLVATFKQPTRNNFFPRLQICTATITETVTTIAQQSQQSQLFRVVIAVCDCTFYEGSTKM